MVNKSIFLSLLLIGVVAASAGAGTWATFSDTETSAGNTFTAGTLDLKVAGADSIPVVLEDVYPGKTGSTTVPVSNDGTVGGDLTLSITDIHDISGSIAGATGEYVDANADLGDSLIIEVDSPLISGVEYNGPLNDFPVAGLDLGFLAGESSTSVFVSYSVPVLVGNEIQGDEVDFDLTLELMQNV